MILRRVIFIGMCIFISSGAASAAVSDWQAGPAALLKVPSGGVHEQDFSYGLDTRFNFSGLSGNLLALFSQGTCPQSSLGVRVDTYANLGAVVTFNPVRLGAYAGPRVGYFFSSENGNSHEFDTSLNLRFTGDFLIGPYSMGVSYTMDGNVPLDQLTFNTVMTSFNDHQGRFGLSFLAYLR